MCAELAQERGWWCAAMRAPETPTQQYAAISLEGWEGHTRPRRTMICKAGPDHLWDAAAEEWLQAALEPHVGWDGDVSSLIRAPIPPRIALQTANMLQATEIHTWEREVAAPGGQSRPAHCGALQKWGSCVQRRPVPAGRHSRAPASHAPKRPCSCATPGARQLRGTAGGVGGSRGRQPTSPPPPGHCR